MSRPQSRFVSVNATNPEAAAQCDRCGFWYQRSKLMWQVYWAGTQLYNNGVLVCEDCMDRPNEQLRTIILPPDPPPDINARTPNYAYQEQTPIVLQFAGIGPGGSPPWGSGPQSLVCTQDGLTVFVLQYLTSS